jgi:hypothetical protein
VIDLLGRELKAGRNVSVLQRPMLVENLIP